MNTQELATLITVSVIGDKLPAKEILEKFDRVAIKRLLRDNLLSTLHNAGQEWFHLTNQGEQVKHCTLGVAGMVNYEGDSDSYNRADETIKNILEGKTKSTGTSMDRVLDSIQEYGFAEHSTERLFELVTQGNWDEARDLFIQYDPDGFAEFKREIEMIIEVSKEA